MDHALRSISYIADIGDLLVIMARRRLVPPGSSGGGLPSGSDGNGSGGAGGGSGSNAGKNGSSFAGPSGCSSATEDTQIIGTTPKMICHVFESEEVCWQIMVFIISETVYLS